MKRALVLSGGGSRGAFQVGALEVLIREGHLDFHVLCGVSVGALNAGFLAQASVPRSSSGEPDAAQSLSNLVVYADRLVRFWTGIRDQKELFRRRAGGWAGPSLGKNSVYDATPLRRLLRKEIDPAALCSSGRTLLIGVTSLETGRYHPIRNEPDSKERILDYLIASATTPLYFEPVEAIPPETGTTPQHLVDGGLRNLTPITDALRELPDEIVVLNTYPEHVPERTYRDNLLGTALGAFDFLDRSVDVVADELHQSVMSHARHLMRLKKTWEEFRGRAPAQVQALMEFRDLDVQFQAIHGARLLEISPAAGVLSDDTLDFSPGRIRGGYEHGRERARGFLKARHEADGVEHSPRPRAVS